MFTHDEAVKQFVKQHLRPIEDSVCVLLQSRAPTLPDLFAP